MACRVYLPLKNSEKNNVIATIFIIPALSDVFTLTALSPDDILSYLISWILMYQYNG